MRIPSLADREAVRHRSILPRFRDAFGGVWYAYREEPNLRFHVFAGVTALLAGYAVRLEGWEAAYLAVTILLVLLTEMVNTAVERAVDLGAAGRRHPLAAQAKEVAAGAVLLVAGHAFVAAVYLFLVRRGLVVTLSALLVLFRDAPWLAVFPVLLGLAGLLVGQGNGKR